MFRKIYMICIIGFLNIGLINSGFAQEKMHDPDALRFQDEINIFKQWDKKNSFPTGSILFVGSSSIRMWLTHHDFPEYPVINRGFGGSHISDVLYFYNDVIKKYAPPIIVFYAGDNDIAGNKTKTQVFEDYCTLVEKIQKDLPKTKLIYIPIKPSLSRWQYWEKMNQVNLLIKKYNSKNDGLFYIDLATPMLNASAKPKKTLFLEDGLHLNKTGYSLWQSLLYPILTKLYNTPD